MDNSAWPEKNGLEWLKEQKRKMSYFDYQKEIFNEPSTGPWIKDIEQVITAFIDHSGKYPLYIYINSGFYKYLFRECPDEIKKAIGTSTLLHSKELPSSRIIASNNRLL